MVNFVANFFAGGGREGTGGGTSACWTCPNGGGSGGDGADASGADASGAGGAGGSGVGVGGSGEGGATGVLVVLDKFPGGGGRGRGTILLRNGASGAAAVASFVGVTSCFLLSACGGGGSIDGGGGSGSIGGVTRCSCSCSCSCSCDGGGGADDIIGGGSSDVLIIFGFMEDDADIDFNGTVSFDGALGGVKLGRGGSAARSGGGNDGNDVNDGGGGVDNGNFPSSDEVVLSSLSCSSFSS